MGTKATALELFECGNELQLLNAKNDLQKVRQARAPMSAAEDTKEEITFSRCHTFFSVIHILIKRAMVHALRTRAFWRPQTAIVSRKVSVLSGNLLAEDL